jgi:[glutamine synthetase] adenylyltransferase / [glutamine synthetase]-adenylyl-L-tyrosine phosphorylase
VKNANRELRSLIHRVVDLPFCTLPDGDTRMRDFLAREDAREALSPFQFGENAKTLQPLLETLFYASPFLTDIVDRNPTGFAECLQEVPEQRVECLLTELARSIDETESFDAASKLLRQFKTDLALLVALCDIGGVWGVEEATRVLTLGADCAVHMAVTFLLREAARGGKFHPVDPDLPCVQSGYIVIGMGKQGAYELNYSSDIDLIIFFDPDIAPLAEGAEATKFFVRLTRDLVKLLHERTADGYVYRVDLRLRPDPGATNIAISVAGGLQYYESLGQNWERAAMIKARPVAGDIDAGEAFLTELHPFIWRRNLDYATINDVHAMKRQIHAHKGHGTIAVAGHNVKLGRGGIREIEFFVQTQQLIAGGRQPELRGRGTLEMLQRLADAKWITGDAAADLGAAYRFLRMVEHRLQMVRDEQTHTLPVDPEPLELIARFCGFPDVAGFSEELTVHMVAVQSHYAALFEDAPGLSSDAGSLVFTGDDDDPETLETLAGMGFDAPAQVISTVRGWHFGRYRATRSATSRTLITELTPALLESLAESNSPQRALTAFDAFLEALPTGVQLFAMLRANPKMMRLVTTILGTAPRLADLLSRRPNMLDAVLDPDFFSGPVEPGALGNQLDQMLADASDYEDALNRARIFGHEQSFIIGVRQLSDALPTVRVGRAYADLADILTDRLLKVAEAKLAVVNGTVGGGRAVVMALGKLGGREMTASSDLDLMLIYDFPEGVISSDGAKPISPQQYYARLTQRLIAALSAPTAEGTLYEVDMRLRPSGNAGPVATSLSRFTEYHDTEAWTWETMTLTRARIIAGDPGLAEDVDNIVRDNLSRYRDHDVLRKDVLEMRQRIYAGKGSKNPWDIKTVRGGLIDVEFAAQYLQLLNAGQPGNLLERNTLVALQGQIDAGLLEPAIGETLLAASKLYQDLTQVIRLCITENLDPPSAPPGFQALLARAAGLPDFKTLDAHLRQSEADVEVIVHKLLNGVFEDIRI